jgi:hypothetical protein
MYGVVTGLHGRAAQVEEKSEAVQEQWLMYVFDGRARSRKQLSSGYATHIVEVEA